MVRAVAVIASMVLVLSGMSGTIPARAQAQPAAICVSTFADTNGNGVRDADEGALAGVNVNLSTGGAIIATHITAEGESEYCFENLLRGEYTVRFTEAPTYHITTPREGAFLLDAEERLTVDPLGAIPVPLDQLRADLIAEHAAQQGADEPLDTATRLLLATVGSMMVMLFMIGLGAVFLGLSGRQRKSPPPPTHITPPRW